MLTGAELVAVSCWQLQIFSEYQPYEGLSERLAADTLTSAESSLAAAVADTEGAVAVRTHVHVVEGFAAAALIEASKEAALLVVGSRGHGSWSGLLLGSVGLHCSTHASCPVVIVRDLESASP